MSEVLADYEVQTTKDVAKKATPSKVAELVTLTQEFNAPQDIALSVTSGLEKFFLQAKEQEETIAAITISSPDQYDKMQLARTIRLQIRAKRLEAKKIMESNRARVKAAIANQTLEDKLWLRAYQMLEAVCDNLETKAEEKEKFAERWEAEQKQKRVAERLAKLSPISDNDELTDRSIVENMTDEAFDRYFGAVKMQYEAKIEEQKKAEKERIAREKAEAQERERIRLENERLRKEAAEREAQHRAEQERLRKEREAAEAKAQAERKAAEAKAKAERDEIERKAAEQKRIADEQLAKERAQRAKLEAEAKAKMDAEIAELKAKEEAERKAEAERKKAAKAPDADKLRKWVASFVAPDCLGLSTDEAKAINADITAKFESFKTWATKQTESL